MPDGKKLTYKSVALTALTPHPNNVRQGDVGAICQSLEAHGQYRPIVAQVSTGHILAGNHTYLAAKALGWKKIDVAYVDVDDTEARKILLVDNRTNDLAVYDDHALADLLASLSKANELDGTGFDDDDLDDLLFRLNGSSGTLRDDGVSAGERLEKWQAAGVRSIILPYNETEWEELCDMLKDLRNRFDVDSNADVVAKLVRDACA